MILTLDDFALEATEGVTEFYLEVRSVDERECDYSVRALARGSKHITGVYYCAGTIAPAEPGAFVAELEGLYTQALHFLYLFERSVWVGWACVIVCRDCRRLLVQKTATATIIGTNFWNSMLSFLCS